MLVADLPMSLAVGTSLAIITTQSLAGFVGVVQTAARIDWLLLVTLTLLALTGMAGGLALGRRVSGAKLRAGFGWFVLAMSAVIAVAEMRVVVARALKERRQGMWLPLLGAFFIGLSKSGFATGLGMLTTPLVAARDDGATGHRDRAAAAVRRRRA